MTTPNFPIETDRLFLRSFQRGDLDALCAYHSLPSVQRYVVKRSRDAEETALALDIMRHNVSLQRPGDMLTLALVCKRDGALVGQVSLLWADATAGQGEVFFCIDPAKSGQGYMGEALDALFDLAFTQFGIHRLSARCDGRSQHSIRLLQQLGMRLEAHFREHALFQGEWDEELRFAILDREWRRSGKVHDLPPRHRVA